MSEAKTSRFVAVFLMMNTQQLQPNTQPSCSTAPILTINGGIKSYLHTSVFLDHRDSQRGSQSNTEKRTARMIGNHKGQGALARSRERSVQARSAKPSTATENSEQRSPLRATDGWFSLVLLSVSSPPRAAGRAPTSGAPPSFQASKLPNFLRARCLWGRGWRVRGGRGICLCGRGGRRGSRIRRCGRLRGSRFGWRGGWW